MNKRKTRFIVEHSVEERSNRPKGMVFEEGCRATRIRTRRNRNNNDVIILICSEEVRLCEKRL